jgi:transposase
MSYSLDLREKVLSHVESGCSQLSASKIFGIGERTIRRWIILKKETNSLSPRPHGGGRPYKANPSELKAYITANPDKTLEELARKFNAGKTSIWRCLRKINYVHKKNSTLC